MLSKALATCFGSHLKSEHSGLVSGAVAVIHTLSSKIDTHAYV